MGPRGSLRVNLTDVHRFPIFLSYGEEAGPIKDRIKAMIDTAINTQLSRGDWPLQFPVWDWRDMPAEKAPPGGKTNDLFVDMARRSSVTIVVLVDRVPDGTKEELLAVKDDQEVDLKVFWFPSRRHRRRFRGDGKTVQRFLDDHKDDFKWTPIDDADSQDAWIAIASHLVSVLLSGMSSRPELPYVEAR